MSLNINRPLVNITYKKLRFNQNNIISISEIVEYIKLQYTMSIIMNFTQKLFIIIYLNKIKQGLYFVQFIINYSTIHVKVLF